jgi:hypothetical protein
MNKKLMIGLALGVLMLSIMACGIDFGSSSPMPTLMPTLGSQPMYIPPTAEVYVQPTAEVYVQPTQASITPTSKISSVLKNNGFSFLKNDTLDDGTPCVDYSNTQYSILALSCNGGILLMGQQYDSSVDSDAQINVVVTVIQEAFGYDVYVWVVNHASPALEGTDQRTVIGNYNIALKSDTDAGQLMMAFIPAN